PPPRKVSAQRECDTHRRVEMRARDLAHEQDDRHHHQPGRDHRRGPADRIRKRLPHNAATSGNQHQEERAQQLREQPPPLPRRILKVLEHRNDTLRGMLREVPGFIELAGSPTLNRLATHLTPLTRSHASTATASRSRPPWRTPNSPVSLGAAYRRE